MKIPAGSFLSFLSEPLCLHESFLRQMFVEHLTKQVDFINQSASTDRAGDAEDYLPTLDELIITDGVALIPIHGVMVKRSQIWHGWFSSRVIVGSDHWATLIGDLINRTDITALVFDFDTGGGQVAGTERLGDAIWKARQAGKTTIAVCNEFAASAGLWAASQCERVVIPATGSIGSLGVYTVHVDNTKAWAEFGFEKTVIHRGKYKGIDERPLDADAKADLQRFIDGKYSLFVDAVARGRGLSADEVTERWGESQLFTGREAVDSGLADEIGTLQDVLESLRAGRGGRVSIEVPPAEDCDPEADPEDGAQTAMVKINATGQILDKDGKAVGNVSELQIDAAGLTKYFAAQTGELIESAVKSAKEAAELTHKAELQQHDAARIAQLDALVAAVGPEKGLAAFKAGQTVEAAKAALADDLAVQLKETNAELAKLRETASISGKAPAFVASDSKADPAKGDQAGSKPSEFAADWAANKDNCQADFPSEELYAAYRRHKG